MGEQPDAHIWSQALFDGIFKQSVVTQRSRYTPSHQVDENEAAKDSNMVARNPLLLDSVAVKTYG